MWRQILSRRPGQAWASPKVTRAVSSGEQVTLHKVRLQPRKGFIRRALVYGITASVCYVVWDQVAFLPLSWLDPRIITQADEKELEPLFLPFPFTERQVQPLPYAGAEEEWQGFIKFNQDTQLRKRVKDDLTLMVKKAAENNPFTKKWAKSGDGFRLGPTWLIISFPERPPPEFIRWGLEWNPEGLFVKTQKVDSRTKVLIDRVLMPYPVASASYAFMKAMVQQNVSTVAKYFGYSPDGKELNTSSPNPEIEKTLKKLEARQTTTGGTAASSSSTAASTTSAPPSEANATPGTPPKASDTDSSDEKQDLDRPSVKDHIPYYSTLVEKGFGPWATFVETYKRAWKPLRYYPPRGSLAVHGLVALDSPKGRVFVDVFAWYHPKTDSFHQDSLTINLRSISPYNQTPKR